MTRPSACWLAVLLLAGASPPNEGARSDAVPRPRDGDVAIGQELEAARKAKTVEAYDLFIARHPDHPLAETARRDRERLRKPER